MGGYQRSIEFSEQTRKRTRRSAADTAAANVWAAMASVYGALWINAYGETPPAVWSAAIAALKPEQLDRALRYFAFEAATPRAFPPTLPEFRFRALDVPIPADAVARALAGDERHWFVARMIKRVSTWDRSHMSARELSDRYAALYERTLSDLVGEVNANARTAIEHAPGAMLETH